MDHVEALNTALEICAAALDVIGPDDFVLPTACSDWNLGELVGHVVGATEAFATVLTGGATPARARVDLADVSALRLRVASSRVVEGWRTPGNLDRSFDSVIELDGGVLIPPIPLPGSMLLAINLLDVGVHAHDVTGAIGRPDLAAHAAVARATLDAAQLILQPGIRELAGFGPERPAASDDDIEVLLAFVGR